MTVVNPKSISGINSITTGSGSDNLLTIHTSDASNTERFRIDSTGTTKIVTGIVTTLTATTGIVTTLTASTVTSLGDVDIADKIVHTGDTDTAIRFSAADTVSVETGGTQKLSLGSATVFNETGADVDFRIESSGTANMFLLDAGNNRIGLNRPTPIEMFEVGGNIFLSSNTSNANEGNALKFQSKTGGFDTSYGAAIHGLRVGNASSYLRFDTGGQSEKMRLDSSGRLLMGTTTEGFSTADDLTIATSTDTGITIRSGTSNQGNIFFADGTSGDAEYRGIIQYTHGSGTGEHLRLFVNATEKVRIDSDGLKLNGDTAAANALDDYEEGSWTPDLNGGGSSNWTSKDGKYQKVGNTVTCWMRVDGGSNPRSGSSGHLTIYNIPFALTGDSNQVIGTCGANVDGASGQNFIVAIAGSGNPFIRTGGQNTTGITVSFFTAVFTYNTTA